MEVRSNIVWATLCIAGTLCTHAVAQVSPASTNVTLLASRSANSPLDLDNQHTIRPGDKLSFRVEEDREEAKPLMVTDSGEVELPSPFGRFHATGKTCKTLAQEIRAALEKDYYKHATVHLGIDAMNNVRGKAYVSGQVMKPGPVNIPVESPLKLSQAILITGPPTQWAKLKEVKVVRQSSKGTQTTIVDVDAIVNKGRPEKDVVLEPDDLVIVPERGVIFGGN
jgi:protein involved in polysaccharide export with SLBB domain